MKKLCTSLCLLALLLSVLVSCDRSSATPPASDTDGASSVSSRLAYYETLVGELNAELLSLRQELYLQELSYETRIATLEASLRGMTGSGTGETGGSGNTNTDTVSSVFLYVLRDGEATVTGYTGTESAITLPPTLEGCPVVAIGERAFANHSSLRSVVLPASVRSVGWFAFSGCVSLCDVTLGDAVESIAYGAFENCNRSLTLHCSAGSYAQKYAHSYGLGVVT